ncbi:DUF4112 domain-containing protein [Sphingomonas sp. SFZ2018-12]|uniref:DUF4112 domain-containing protein n=1 Tax=Sphingomonas sp. SFZ2018-12 TaxID=2683197 RepID=UPI001F0F4A9B|nr:DUF4112 domain-containing protein [Sphingomonas sp. SFZ2018-12]MCH4894818.1 DUF4112 domain-containing protein [Sphingomonas sp. SFZ2018-12]
MAKPNPVDPATLDRIAAALQVGTDPASVRRRVEAIERVLERAFTIPGTQQQFGLDALLSLMPVGGSFIAAAMGSYILWEARNLGLSRLQMARMAGNVGFDWLLGLIPVVGAVPDLFFRSNSRNLKIIRRHLDKHHPATVTIQG